MRNGIRRPSPAMLVALIALFVAMGGSALAVTAAKNSVKSKSIKNGQVKTKDLANAAVNARSSPMPPLNGQAHGQRHLNAEAR